MIFSSVVMLAGGLMCFLYGMTLLTRGLAGISRARREKQLRRRAAGPRSGLLLGLGMTAVVQSSSVVLVMLMGLVEAGLVSFRTAVGVILGADLGTTATAWLFTLTLRDHQALAGWMNLTRGLTWGTLAAGSLLALNGKWPHGSRILLGCGALLCGLGGMTAGAEPLAMQPGIIRLMTVLAHPLASFTAGLLFTGVIQSSSAGIGVLQVLAAAGMLTGQMACPLILGMNVGTTATALLACIGRGAGARRTALAQVLIKRIGAASGLPLFCLAAISGRCGGFLPGMVTPEEIALLHTGFNLFTVALVWPFRAKLIRFCRRILP